MLARLIYGETLRDMFIPCFKDSGFKGIESFANKKGFSVAEISEEISRRKKDWTYFLPNTLENLEAFTEEKGEELSAVEKFAEFYRIELSLLEDEIERRGLTLQEKKNDDVSDCESVSSKASSTSSKKKKGILVVNKKKPIQEVILEQAKEEESYKGKPGKKYRGFAITDFVRDKEFFPSLFKKGCVQYVLAAQEICEKTGEKHWQCCIQFVNPRTWSGVQKLMAPRHVETIFADFGSNIRYCKKGLQTKKEYNKFYQEGPNYGKGLKIIIEEGEPPAQGKRTDIDEIYNGIMDGSISSLEDVAEKNPLMVLQYNKGLSLMLKFRRIKRDWKTKLVCFWGLAGSGKTLQCFEYEKRFHEPDAKFEIDDISLSGQPGNPFVAGYKGSEAVLLDDFDPDMCKIEWFLKLTDRYAMRVNIKGDPEGYNWNPKRIYITMNAHPKTLWGGWSDQVKRRFKSDTKGEGHLIFGVESLNKLEEDKDEEEDFEWKLVKQNPLDKIGVLTKIPLGKGKAIVPIVDKQVKTNWRPFNEVKQANYHCVPNIELVSVLEEVLVPPIKEEPVIELSLAQQLKIAETQMSPPIKKKKAVVVR